MVVRYSKKAQRSLANVAGPNLKGHVMSHLETAIIGSGPYGLSLAAHLRHQGVPFGLFGQPMESWSAYMPKGMLLKSEPFASNLWDPLRANTLEAFCYKKRLPYRPTGWAVPIDTFLAYAAWFQERTGVSPNGSTVTRIDMNEQGMFSLTTSDGGQWTARHVVVATGHMPFMYVPEPLRELPDNLLAHTAQLHDLARFCGRDVTVVGAGQSALETAALLVESGARVRLIARRQITWNPPSKAKRSLRERIRAPESGLAPGWRSLFFSEMPRVFRHFPVAWRHKIVATKWGPAGTAWLVDRLVNKAELLTGRTIESAKAANGGVRLIVTGSHGTETIDTDYVVAGTGFKADIDNLAFLSEKLRARVVREDRAPRLTASWETSVPNLFVVGILSAPAFGPVMRFMFGAKHAAHIVSRRIAARSSHLKKRISIAAANAPAESLSQRS
jgi:cation diffusion facilitator CzcD-associated flavoprotein CzcO